MGLAPEPVCLRTYLAASSAIKARFFLADLLPHLLKGAGLTESQQDASRPTGGIHPFAGHAALDTLVLGGWKAYEAGVHICDRKENRSSDWIGICARRGNGTVSGHPIG